MKATYFLIINCELFARELLRLKFSSKVQFYKSCRIFIVYRLNKENIWSELFDKI